MDSLFIDLEFANNESWRFIDAAYEFMNPENPLGENFPECITINLSESPPNNDLDFIGVKIGDVNNSYIPCSELIGVDDRKKNASLAFQNRGKIQAHEEFFFDVKIEQEEPLVAFQTGIQFDQTKLEFLEARPAQLADVTPANFGLTEIENGKIRALWYDSQAQAIDFSKGKVAYQLKFRAKQKIEDWSEVIHIENSVMPSMTFMEDGTETTFGMTHQKVEKTFSEVAAKPHLVVQSSPNPFDEQLELNIETRYPTPFVLQIFDTKGKEVWRQIGETAKGVNPIILNDLDNLPAGVYAWQVRIAGHSESGKVVKR